MNKQINWSKYTFFQQRVLRKIMKIPAGQVWTYGQVAKRLGNPNLARAVGHALGKNQDSPQIPCHRVVGTNSVGGFSLAGGVKKKLAMLRKENCKLENYG